MGTKRPKKGTILA